MKNHVTVLASLAFALTVGAGAAAQVPPPKPSSSTTGTTGTTGTTPSAPRFNAADNAADYRLVAGDKLRIEVYKDAQLSQSLQVRPDGKITLPLIGDLTAAGRTSAELRESITTSLKEYNTNPVVTVIVVETVPPVIYVMGEVNNSGPQALTAQMTVLQALASAGGFKDFANTKDIRILRKSSTGIATTLRFNYKDAMKGIGKPIVLQPGDTIIVP